MKLVTYQSSFLAALWQTDEVFELAAQPGFAVYRNTVMKGCVDALAANYPAVLSLVGETWFRAAAADFVRTAPPPRASLLDYGAGFADFLASFPPADDLRWLVPIAHLDRHWTEAHVAGDFACADPALLARVDADGIVQLRLRPHPAARWLWHDAVPVHTLWTLNRGRVPMPADGLASVRWIGEGALTTRRADEVTTQAVPHAACVLLDACAAGARIVEAIGAALAIDATLDLTAVIAQLLRAGAFLPPEPYPDRG